MKGLKKRKCRQNRRELNGKINNPKLGFLMECRPIHADMKLHSVFTDGCLRCILLP